MLYLHDVWVNWFEGEENGYNVCYFHEWRKDDGVELLDQVPLLKIDTVLFNYIENDLAELPQKLLDNIYQKAFLRWKRNISCRYNWIFDSDSKKQTNSSPRTTSI